MKLLAAIDKAIGKTGITNGSDIDKIMKPIFGTNYIGIVRWKSPKDVPYLEEGQVCILNKDTHWTATYKKQGKLYEIDSFNRDLLGSKYHDAKVPKSFVQPPFNTDCGQRAMSELIVSYFSKK